MRGLKHWWILWLAAALLVVPACTENNLDESDADVILEVLGSTTPNVEAVDVEGSCSGDPLIKCTNDLTCSEQGLGFCDFDPTSGCDVKAWTFTMFNEPLNEGASQSALNNVEVISVGVTYDWPLGVVGPAAATVVVGTVIDVNGTGTISFNPIRGTDIPAAPTDAVLNFVWNARTVSGQTVQVIGGGAGVLTIEDCL